jgi:hypothetical protein
MKHKPMYPCGGPAGATFSMGLLILVLWVFTWFK